MEQERQLTMEKRRQEREYLQKMMVENERQKKISNEQKEKERQEDIAAQEAYAAMLDKQERDRIQEMKNRENRAQEFMNRMADTVIKKMDERQRDEDDKIRRYEMEKEMRDRLEDERRMNQVKNNQAQMREFLAK